MLMRLTDRPGVRIGILLYVNRSGSTLLSRLIGDECDGVFVFPETGFIIDMLMAAQAGHVVSGDRLCRLVEDDPRRSALGLSSRQLAEICQDHDSRNLGDFLLSVATAACGKRPSAILIKHEKLAYLTHIIPSVIENASFIHIVRDPRAVVGSMLRTPVPEKPGFDMARGSVLYAARHWRNYLRRLETIARRQPILELRYEDLGEDGGRAACARVAASLGVMLRAGEDGSRAAPRYRIAAIDRPLHPMIYDRFDRLRSSGWQIELTQDDIRLVEATCGSMMEARNYPPAAGMIPLGRWRLLSANLRHAFAMARHVAGTARHYARRPDRLQAMQMHLGLSINKLRVRRAGRRQAGLQICCRDAPADEGDTG